MKNLKEVLSKMKVSQMRPTLPKAVEDVGNSGMFANAIGSVERSKENKLQIKKLNKWNELVKHDSKMSRLLIPLNRFEELIQLTEEGKLWKFPIDNEQGMYKEKKVPFEDHVFLDDCLEDFPKNEHIQNFMEYVIAGLAKNHWMTVERKHIIIKFYKDYFDKKRDLYKAAGFDIDTSTGQ